MVGKAQRAHHTNDKPWIIYRRVGWVKRSLPTTPNVLRCPHLKPAWVTTHPTLKGLRCRRKKKHRERYDKPWIIYRRVGWVKRSLPTIPNVLRYPHLKPAWVTTHPTLKGLRCRRKKKHRERYDKLWIIDRRVGWVKRSLPTIPNVLRCPHLKPAWVTTHPTFKDLRCRRKKSRENDTINHG